MNRKVTEYQTLPPGWRVMRLEDAYDISAGGDFDPATTSINQDENHPYPIYSNALTNRGLYGYSSYSKYAEDSITITARGCIGAANHRKTKFVAIGRVLVLKNKVLLSNEFVCEYINHSVRFFKETTGVPQLTAPQASKYYVTLPPLPEQKAIASLLEKWDTAIEKTESFITAKRQQFRWLVKLLIGQKQYTDEWKLSTLGNLFNICTHSSKSKYIVGEGEMLVVDMGSISRTGQLIANKHTNIEVDILQMDDLVMPKDDIGGGNIIGKVAIIDKENKYICGDHVYRLVQKNVGDACFLRFLINCPPINRQLRSKANGTAQLGLGKRDVIDQQVRLPSFSEQNRISYILNTAQYEIILLEQLAEKYRTQKRGLMQKSLTGQWRLPPN